MGTIHQFSRALLLCALVAGISIPGLAGPIAGIGIRLWGDSLISVDNFTPVAGVTTQSISSSESVSGTNLTYNYSATGLATNSFLSTYSTANLVSGGTTFGGSVPNLTPSHYAYALATAGFLDNLNITSPGQSGTGFLYLTFHVDGTSSSTSGLVDAHGQIGAQSAGGNPFVNLGSGTFNATLDPITFQFGTSFNLLYFLSSTVKFNTASPLDGLGGTADYSHTALFPTVEIRNANGAVLSAYTVGSQQGISYLQTVPEPSTFALAFAGLLLAGFTRRTRNL